MATQTAQLIAEAKALGAQKRAAQTATDIQIVAAFASSKLGAYITAPDPETKAAAPAFVLRHKSGKHICAPKHWQFVLKHGRFVEVRGGSECDRLSSRICKACKLEYQRSDHRTNARMCDVSRSYACKTCKHAAKAASLKPVQPTLVV